jgi:hypothetical protein
VHGVAVDLNRRHAVRIWFHMPDLENCVVKDVEGRDVRLGDLWRDGPVVLVFVRHFG